MDVRFASQGAPDWPGNEDLAFVVDGVVGVLDGVTSPAGVETGCVHSPAWHVHRLAARLSDVYGAEPSLPLAQSLAAAIEGVRGEHGE